MKFKIAILIIGLFLNIKSFSQTWTYVGRNEQKEPYYIKKHSESYGSNKVWIKHISKTIKYYKRGKTLIVNGYTLTLYETDCTERKLNLRSVTTYMNNGNVVDSHSNGEYENDWSEVIPDSVGEMFLDKACEILR